MKIVIIDYGLGNIFSIEKAFSRIGEKVIISSDESIISKADKLVIPGVGHFKFGMKNLETNMLKKTILNKINVDKIPVLGICLGMQLMTAFSEEGNINGLGLIDLRVDKIKSDKLKIPHMGWNTVESKQDLRLFKGIDNKETFYFVHSYCINEQNNRYKCGYTNYASKFISTYEENNIFGVQFHPEKSHDQGLQLISNFRDI